MRSCKCRTELKGAIFHDTEKTTASKAIFRGESTNASCSTLRKQSTNTSCRLAIKKTRTILYQMQTGVRGQDRTRQIFSYPPACHDTSNPTTTHQSGAGACLVEGRVALTRDNQRASRAGFLSPVKEHAINLHLVGRNDLDPLAPMLHGNTQPVSTLLLRL